MDSAALIAELNDAVAHGTVDQRAKILHRITKLFVVASAGYSDEQIELFDDVLMRVAATIELSARAVLACLLAGPSARADIPFCNQFPHLVYVALAYPQNGGSWISRGWISLKTGECSLFDPALRVKTFYYRGESAAYRGASGKRVKNNWGSGRSFAIREAGNFNYWDAQQKVLDSSLADFTHAGGTNGDAISVTVTFNADGNGSSVTIK
jgi:uncharacterized membrane protein